MNPILANPFRALGLIANSSEREIQKQVATFSAYARVGKPIESDCDFPLLPPVERTEETIRFAAGKIEQPVNRLHYALFWFLSSNHIDETALGYLRNNDSAKAAEIWNLAVLDKSITAKNFSAAHNLATLQFLFSSLNGSLNPAIFESAVRLKGKAVSECFDEFTRQVAGDKVSADRLEILKLFSDDIIRFSDLHNGHLAILVNAFTEFPANIRSYVVGKVIDRPVANIREQIEEAVAARVDNPEDAEIFGDELYEASIEDLNMLRSILGPEHPQFQMIANDLANELLQCSIDFFNEFVDSDDIDPGEDALRLINYARSVGPTGAVKHRIEENAPTIERWVAETANRTLNKSVSTDIEFIGTKLKLFQSEKESAKRAAELIEVCKPALANLAHSLANEQGLYMKLCDAVASNALGMAVSSVNRVQEEYSLLQGFFSGTARSISLEAISKARDISDVKREVSDASAVISLLAGMDMSSSVRQRCQENARVLKRLREDLGIRAQRPSAKQSAATTNTPAFTAPLSTSPGAFSRFFGWLTESPKRFFGFLGILGAVGLCVFSSLVSNNTGTSKNTNAVSSSTLSNTSTTKNIGDGTKARVTPSATLTPTPTPTPKTERPETGAIMSRGSGGRGLGTLTISNGTSSDAIAKLVNLSTGKSHREIYVRANSSATLSGIAPGEYELLFSMGREYAPSIRKFLRDAEYSKFDQTFYFQETRDAYGINYKTFRVTLDKVAYGTATTSTIDESSFDNK